MLALSEWNTQGLPKLQKAIIISAKGTLGGRFLLYSLYCKMLLYHNLHTQKRSTTHNLLHMIALGALMPIRILGTLFTCNVLSGKLLHIE